MCMFQYSTKCKKFPDNDFLTRGIQNQQKDNICWPEIARQTIPTAANLEKPKIRRLGSKIGKNSIFRENSKLVCDILRHKNKHFLHICYTFHNIYFEFLFILHVSLSWRCFDTAIFHCWLLTKECLMRNRISKFPTRPAQDNVSAMCKCNLK